MCTKRSRISLYSFILLATVSQASGSCGPGDVSTFELVTGAIFVSDTGKIGSLETFDITECIAACRNDSNCASANFETGLCTISRNSASAQPDALRTDDFPVFPSYLEKICLRAGGPVSKDWAFQRIVNHFLPGSGTKSVVAASKQECLNACLNEKGFSCASAEYHYASQKCVLSNTSQSLLQVRLQAAEEGYRVDYFENDLAKEPRTYCEFNRVRGRVLKSADSVRSKVASLDECRSLCLKSKFSCNYYHYGQLSDDECSLSHHTPMSVAHIKEPYVFSADFVSFELRACFSVDLTCDARGMTASVTTNRVFDGLVYAKEHAKTCMTDVSNSSLFNLRMPLDGSICGTKSNGKGLYSNYIMVQYNDRIVTSKDMGLAVSCEYDLGSQNVTGSLSTNGAPAITENVNYKVPAPVVQMTITGAEGKPVGSATVGDKIYLQFDLGSNQASDIYGIFARDVVAVDAKGKSKIKLIDSNGCPADDIVLGPVESLNRGRTLRIPIEAFKFPSNDEVEFMALIKPCQKECEPAQCVDQATQIIYNSFGKKRRKRENVPTTSASDKTDKTTNKDLVLHHRISINDMFSESNNADNSPFSALPYQIQAVGKQTQDLSGIVCIHKTAVAVAASLILLIQVVFAVALTLLCQRYRCQQKSKFKAQLDISPTSTPSKSSVISNLSSDSSVVATSGSVYNKSETEEAIYDLCRTDSLNDKTLKMRTKPVL